MRYIIQIFILLLIPNVCFAWGPSGHKITCFIADELLSASDKAQLESLVRGFEFKGYEYGYYSSACNFADVARAKARRYERAVEDGNSHDEAELLEWARFSKFEKWHFLNLKRDDFIVENSDCPDDIGCLLVAVEFHSNLLQVSSGSNKAEAALLLGHWMGDLHQPMHVSFKGGGGEINRVDGIYGWNTNMHRVWDSGILNIAMRQKSFDWLDMGRELLSEITPTEIEDWQSGTPIDWAQESFDIAIKPDVEYCKMNGNRCRRMGRERTFDNTYQQAHQDTVKLRLKQAGVRLAKLISEGLSGGQN